MPIVDRIKMRRIGMQELQLWCKEDENAYYS